MQFVLFGAGASLGNSGRGVQGHIFRQKGVVVERFSRQGRGTHSGEARGHACHAVRDRSFSELKILFMNFHGQNAHKTKILCAVM